MKILTSIAVLLMMVGLRAESQQLNQPWFVVDHGGGKGGGGFFSVDASIGQPVVQSGSGGDFTLQGGFIPGLGQLSETALTVDVSVGSGWDMISVPLTVSDSSKTTLFPSAVSNAFAYEGSYVIKSTLAHGIGYWLRFSRPQTLLMTGYLRSRDTLNVSEGWNLIGSISLSVSTTQITSDPPGIVTSQFFGWAGTYQISQMIDPGKAYWVKVSQSGKLILSISVNESNVAGIKITPISELPPAPPEVISNHLQLPIEYGLSEAYPNPFNPSSTIKYQLPTDSKVSLKVYNLLGQVVQTFVNDIEPAGFKSVEWNASAFASGIYFYKLDAVSISDPSKSFVNVKKIVLMK